jgi:hypothetical protein
MGPTKVQRLSTHWWFQNFQHDILADALLDTMIRLFEELILRISVDDDDMFESYYRAAIFDMEYYWLSSDPHMYAQILNIVKTKLKNK